MERTARPHGCGELPGGYILWPGLGKVIEMIEWNEQRLEELVRKMGLKRVPGQGKTPVHLSLYNPHWNPEPLLTKIMCLDASKWTALGYTETDRVSVTRYLGSLGCRTDGALSAAAHY